MKLLILFAFLLATASAASLVEKLVPQVEEALEQPLEQPVLWKDMKSTGAVDGEIDGRITNGAIAHNGQFPYQVGLSLQNGGGHFWCGGSLIHHQWVLTAAHCTNGVHTVTVYLGNVWRGAGVQHTVGGGNIRQHGGYNPQTLANDISLIIIPHTNYNGEINAAHLTWDNWSYAGWQAVASGWGQTWDGSGVVNELRYIRQTIIENWECERTFGGTYVTGGTLCIATPHGASTCQGDSGGPLVIDGTWTIVGVTSFGSGAGCQSGSPAAFSRVPAFRNWIRDVSGI